MNIWEMYEQAARFHGHKCPGLAIGVRAAAEALAALPGEGELTCVAESRACYLDGVQVLAGCTVGNGRLFLRQTGKAAFSFYRGEESLRLVFKPLPEGLSKPERVQFLLTAPAAEVLVRGPVRAPRPERTPGSKVMRPCRNCGELTEVSWLREKDGAPVCIDCEGR